MFKCVDVGVLLVCTVFAVFLFTVIVTVHLRLDFLSCYSSDHSSTFVDLSSFCDRDHVVVRINQYTTAIYGIECFYASDRGI